MLLQEQMSKHDYRLPKNITGTFWGTVAGSDARQYCFLIFVAFITMRRWIATLASWSSVARGCSHHHNSPSLVSQQQHGGGVARDITTVRFISWPLTSTSTRPLGTFHRSLSVRGGSDGSSDDAHLYPSSEEETQYVTNAHPAPGSPFHYAFPVHDLELAKDFYGRILGCEQGRSSTKWQDFSLHGHQIVCHWVGNDYRCQDYYNPVDGDEVPVPHAGLALTVEEFHALAKRVEQAGITFIIRPHLRFAGMPGEQYTMFFKDPSGNNLEFKAMVHPENLFAKYNVADK